MAFVAPFPGGGQVTRTFESSVALGSGTGQFTFAGMAIGAAAANRYVVVCVAGFTANPWIGCTIGGVTASLAKSNVNGVGVAQVWSALVPSGTTATIAFTAGGSGGGTILIGVYAMQGNSSASPVAANSSSVSGGVISLPNLPPNCAVFGASINQAVGTPTWSGLSEDVSSNLNSSDLSTASIQTANGGSLSVSCSHSGGSTSPSTAVAAWSP